MNTKAASERYQRQVLELSKQPGNSTCADCGGRYPRWASWSLGVFLCVNCAGVHRKMGTHISKVKSLTLDTWSKEQVEKMREIGNEKSNLRYNPDVRRNRPPANVEEGERNSDLERFIFDKYRGRFMDSRPPPVPMKDRPSLSPTATGVPSVTVLSAADSSASSSSRRRAPDSLGIPSHQLGSDRSPLRSSTAPIPSSWDAAKRAASVSPSPTHARNAAQPTPASYHNGTTTASNGSLALPSTASIPPRSSSSAALQNPAPSYGQQQQTNGSAASTNETPAQSSVFNDLLSLQQPDLAPQQPQLQMLQPNQQMNPWAHLAMQQQAVVSPMVMSHSPYFQQPQPAQPQQLLTPHSPFGPAGFAGSQQRSASLGTMAFSNVPTSEVSYFAGAAGTSPSYSAQMMGQQAFGVSGMPAFQQQHMQQAQPLMQQAYQQQQQQQPQQPQQQQQQQQQNNPFGAFANAMMPTGQQQQQSTASWPQHNAWH